MLFRIDRGNNVELVAVSVDAVSNMIRIKSSNSTKVSQQISFPHPPAPRSPHRSSKPSYSGSGRSEVACLVNKRENQFRHRGVAGEWLDSGKSLKWMTAGQVSGFPHPSQSTAENKHKATAGPSTGIFHPFMFLSLRVPPLDICKAREIREPRMRRLSGIVEDIARLGQALDDNTPVSSAC